MIKGVEIRNLTVHEDDRGRLFEMVHNYEMPGALPAAQTRGAIAGKFGQVYVVHNPSRGAVRAFHKHHELWDYFCIVKGSAKFAFVDDRNDAIKGSLFFSTPDPGSVFVAVISGSTPKMIIVPPGVFHGWKSLEDDTILLSVGSEIYVSGKPDEVRVPPDYFNKQFERNVWEQEAK